MKGKRRARLAFDGALQVTSKRNRVARKPRQNNRKRSDYNARTD